MSSNSSFHKKARVKVGQILGTKPSIYNNQLLISTGIPSFDHVIGGGLAVGTVLLVEEDTYGSYAKLVLKYFLAEALMTKQSVFLSSASEDVRQLMKELPASIDQLKQTDQARAVPSSHVTSSNLVHPDGQLSCAKPSDDDKMKIAWRYQDSPRVQAVPTSGVTFGHYYDLTTTMSHDIVSEADVFYADSPFRIGQSDIVPTVPGMNPNYCHLLQEIRSQIQAGGFGTAQDTNKRGILRIGIHSMGSPLWGENGGVKEIGDGFDPSLPLFLIALRGVLRSSLASALITVPTHLFHEASFVRKIERLCDTVIRLDSFAGSDKEKNLVFKEYHGLLQLIQLPRLNSLTTTQPEVTDLAFKLRRKKFTIEKLHLPPEFADTTGRSDDDGSMFSRTVKSGCSSTGTSDLSF